MQPRIEILSEKKLVGKRLKMSLSNNRTVELWKSFMPRRGEIKDTLSNQLFSLQVFDSSSEFEAYHGETIFEKWAAAEVDGSEKIPEGLEGFNLPDGLYAVFLHKGGPATAHKTFEYIFGIWLPHSQYVLDKRPHFEILGDKYKNDDPDSEEEVWIPVKEK